LKIKRKVIIKRKGLDLHAKSGLGGRSAEVRPIVGEDGSQVSVTGEPLHHLRGPEVVALKELIVMNNYCMSIYLPPSNV
jgi:hypothetical protein